MSFWCQALSTQLFQELWSLSCTHGELVPIKVSIYQLLIVVTEKPRLLPPIAVAWLLANAGLLCWPRHISYILFKMKAKISKCHSIQGTLRVSDLQKILSSYPLTLDPFNVSSWAPKITHPFWKSWSKCFVSDTTIVLGHIGKLGIGIKISGYVDDSAAKPFCY